MEGFCLGRGLGLGDLWRSLSTPSILFLCDSSTPTQNPLGERRPLPPEHHKCMVTPCAGGTGCSKWSPAGKAPVYSRHLLAAVQVSPGGRWKPDMAPLLQRPKLLECSLPLRHLCTWLTFAPGSAGISALPGLHYGNDPPQQTAVPPGFPFSWR